MAEWQLRLDGSNPALEALVHELNEPARAVKRDVRGFYITSAAFGTDETAGPTDVSMGALIAELNGLVRVQIDSHAAITLAGLEFARDNGTRVVVGFFERIVAPRAIAVGQGVALRDGAPVPPSRSRLARLSEATATNDDAKRVLRILGADLDWVSMYKVFEIVSKNTRRGETGIAAAGWATMNEMKLFRRTANSVGALEDRARHGKRDPMPPPVRSCDELDSFSSSTS